MNDVAATQMYNGWSNRETWTVNHWLNGDMYLYDELCRLNYLHQYDVDSFSEALKDWVHDELDRQPVPSGMWGDLIRVSLSSVNWHEVAKSNQE